MATPQQGGQTTPSKPAPAPKRGRGRTPVGNDTDIIKLTEKGKSHKKSGRSQERYELYKDNMSISTYIKKCEEKGFPASKARADIKWDRDHGHIEIVEAKK